MVEARELLRLQKWCKWFCCGKLRWPASSGVQCNPCLEEEVRLRGHEVVARGRRRAHAATKTPDVRHHWFYALDEWVERFFESLFLLLLDVQSTKGYRAVTKRWHRRIRCPALSLCYCLPQQRPCQKSDGTPNGQNTMSGGTERVEFPFCDCT